MKNLNKSLIVLIAVAFIFSGVKAQYDVAPNSTTQLKENVKPSKPDKKLKKPNNCLNPSSDYNQLFEPESKDGHDKSAIYWPQDRDTGIKPTFIKPNPTDNLFDLQFSWPVGVGGGEAGIETDGNYIYTTKWNGYEFYRYQMDGTFVESFTCGTAGAVRDLAWDGTYFYGSAANTTVYQMDFDAQTVVSTITAPANIRAIAYNEDDGLFYGNNWSDPIQVFNITGASQGSFATGPGASSIYGLAYDNYSGGKYLWAYAQPGTIPEDQNWIFQIELPSGTETGVSFDVATVIAPGIGVAGGLCVTDQVVPGFWTLMGNMQEKYIWGFELSTSGPPLSDDIGIQYIIEPNSGSGLTSAEEVTITIRNFGANAQSNFNVYFTLNGGSQIVETVTTTINGGETYNYTFSATLNMSDVGDYVIVACTDLTGDEFSVNDCKTKLIEHSEPSTSFCLPTYSTGCNSGDGFTGFAVEEIQNLNSNCENNTGFYGWSEYYGLGPAILFPGFTHTFTMGSGYGNQYVNIWIDYNDDLVLTPNEMILTDYWIEASGVLYETDIEIPVTATSGVHGMRVMAVHGQAFTDPCGFYTWGEAEDYSVLIGSNDVGSVEGYVTKNTGGAPLSGASIVVNNGTYSTTSGPDGFFELTNVLVGNWSIICMADGYNTISGMVSVSNGNTTISDFALTGPTMDISPQAINIIIDPNAQSTEIIDIANIGDGELYWTAWVEKQTDEPKEAWDLQFSFDVQAASGGLGNLGAECDGQFYYTTRWNSNLMHKYDLNGNLIEEFFIPGVSGIRDLAYDGTYFYGGISTHTIYEMDFSSKTLVSSISSPQVVLSIAYDNTEDAFWCADWDSDITLVSRIGVALNTLPASIHGLSGMIGTAFDNGSNGTSYLWIFDQGQGAGTPQFIHQANLATMAMTGFSYNVLNDLGPNSTASAGGLFVVDNVYPGTLSLGGLLQGNPDVFFVYELAPAEPLWLTIDPNSGIVNPGNTGLMEVNFDAFEFLVGTTKTATIHFISDPNVGIISVPVSMTIGSFEFGYIEGNVFLDGISPYNIGDVSDVVIEAGPYTTFPDANGDYILETYPGIFDVVASMYGYETQTIGNITVVEGTTVSGINFVMPCIFGIISGEVSEADGGAPISGATVTLIGSEFVTTTASDGTYDFVVEAGTYDVKAVKGGFGTQTATGVFIGAQSTEIQDFQLEIPERKICIIDLDPTPTGAGLVPIVENFFPEGTIHYTTSISGYPLTNEVETIFLLLGVYPNNYTLTNADAAFVTSWMENNPDRNIYMEGGETWAFDDPTLLHTYFNINGLDDGSSNLVNINGLASFWAGKSWVYTGENNWIDQIEAVPPAINIMENPNAGYFTSVAYDEGTYKTIGSSHEIMGLTGGAGTGLGVAYVMAWFGYPVFTFGSLEGFVMEDQTGDPVEGATINIGGLASGISGPNGYYLIEDALLGTWDATATKQNFHPQTISVTIVEGATTSQDFVLEAPGTLQGIVTELSSGNPVANAMIDVGDGMYTTISVADGTYMIEEILTGNYDVFASKENYHPQNVSVTVASTLVITQDFMLEAPGTLEGTVTESGSGLAVSDAIINVGAGMYTTMTGADGTYVIEEILTGTYTVTCTKYGYTPGSLSVTINESNVFIQDFELFIPQIVVNPMAVDVTMNPNELLDDAINISNPGNGSVDWNGTVVIASDKSKGAWDLQFTFDLETATGGPGNGGAECDGQYYYTTRWASDLIHKFDFDGNLIEEFSIPGVYGLRDLAFDGTHMYGGTATNTIYEMDFENKTLVTSIASPQVVRSIAYDNSEDAFWCADWASDIILVSRAGTVLNTFPAAAHGLTGIYSTAYDKWTTGTPILWIFDQGSGAGAAQLIHQADLNTLTMTGFSHDVMSDLGPDATAIAGGLFIVDNVFPGTWSIGGMIQGSPDTYFLYEVAYSSPSWLTIDPISGSLNGGENEDIVLSFNTFELIPGDYTAQIQFSTSPDVGQPVVEVSLHIDGLIPAVNLEVGYTCTNVEMNWEVAPGGGPDSWNIYRDDVMIANTLEMMYTDEMVYPQVTYGYYIKAVYEGEESMPTSTGTIALPLPVDMEAGGLTATSNAPDENDVSLNWTEPECCVTPDGYNIYRDGFMINESLVTGLAYIDPSLPIGSYEYYVIAVYYFGESGPSEPAYTLITGIFQPDASSFNILPNPARDYVKVQAGYTIISYELLNNAGQVVKTEVVNASVSNIDVSSFDSGIYYLKLITAEGATLNKIAIRK